MSAVGPTIGTAVCETLESTVRAAFHSTKCTTEHAAVSTAVWPTFYAAQFATFNSTLGTAVCATIRAAYKPAVGTAVRSA